MSFEWQTEEDYNWEEEAAPPKPPRRERRRWPWLVLVAVLLVGTAVFLIYRQINRRVEAATDNIESDVIASYAVLQQAAENNDENLFNSLLSGRDEVWAQAQRENLLNDTLFDRQAFGLTWQPVMAETAVISQTFSPELTSVELTTLQNYSLNIGNGLTQTVPLMRIDVYRLGEDRWLYAPPEQEFWGVRQRLEGQLISVRYPARDEAIVHRLSADLEARLVQVCSTPGFTCPKDAHIRLSFSSEPDSLTHFTFLDALTGEQESSDSVWEGGQTIVLPTPMLVGLPQDETGYQALLRGYESYVLTVALNDLIGWECCDHLPFYRAIIERQLYELGVGEWPLAGTAVSLSEAVYLLDAATDWNSPPSETSAEFGALLMSYLTIDFLVDTFGLSPARIGQSLVATPDLQFTDWLAEITGSEFVYEALLNQTFQQYLSRRFGVAQVVPQPGYDMLLLCQDAVDSQTALYQYDFGSGDPDLLQVLGHVDPFMTSLPDGSGVALAVEGRDGLPETYLLRQGKRINVNWDNVAGITENPPLAIPSTADPNGRYLLWTVAPTYSTGSYYVLTDLETCQPGGSCEATPIGGYPNWSPDGQKLITLTTVTPWWRDGLDNGLMLLRDVLTANASNSPGFGASVFWLDDARFGYLNRYQNGVEQLVLTDVDLAPPTTLLTNGSLQGYFSPDERPDSLSLKMAQPLPENPDVLAVVAVGNFNVVDEVSPGYLFWYDRVADSVRIQVDLPNWQNSELEGYRLSPDGRYLLFTYTTPEETAVNLFLVDASEQPPRFLGYTVLGSTRLPRHFYASWTSDGEWLALPELGYIRLWHDGSDEQILNFDGLNCTNAAWVDRMEP